GSDLLLSHRRREGGRRDRPGGRRRVHRPGRRDGEAGGGRHLPGPQAGPSGVAGGDQEDEVVRELSARAYLAAVGDAGGRSRVERDSRDVQGLRLTACRRPPPGRGGRGGGGGGRAVWGAGGRGGVGAGAGRFKGRAGHGGGGGRPRPARGGGPPVRAPRRPSAGSVPGAAVDPPRFALRDGLSR